MFTCVFLTLFSFPVLFEKGGLNIEQPVDCEGDQLSGKRSDDCVIRGFCFTFCVPRHQITDRVNVPC